MFGFKRESRFITKNKKTKERKKDNMIETLNDAPKPTQISIHFNCRGIIINSKCEKCGNEPPKDEIEIEHFCSGCGCLLFMGGCNGCGLFHNLNA